MPGLHQPPPVALSPLYSPHQNSDHRQLPPGHSHHTGGFTTQPTDRRHCTLNIKPISQDLEASAKRSGTIYCHIIDGGTKYITNTPPQSRTGVQTSEVYGASGGCNRHTSAIDEATAHPAHSRLGGGSKDSGAVDRCGDGPARNEKVSPSSVRASNAPGSGRGSKIPPLRTGSGIRRYAGRPRSTHSN